MPTVEQTFNEYCVQNFETIPYGTQESLIQPSLLIEGDSTKILPHLTMKFSNTVKCIYMDPPYNTQNIFEHYHDAQNHDLWLKFI